MMTNERGAALIITLLAMLLLSAVGAALVLATSADVLISANAGASSEAFYAADAAFERTVAELRGAQAFTSVLNGSTASGFTDGSSSAPRALADGSRLDLAEVVNLANCQKYADCTDADMNASIRDRPWGARNPRWRLFSSGPLLAPSGPTNAAIPVYVVSMVADDPAETDADPARDGARTGVQMNPGAGMLLVRAEAFGRRGAHRVIEGAVVRQDLVALARWEATDPATRGPAPSGFPRLQVLAWWDVR
jgi:hypothetical protein